MRLAGVVLFAAVCIAQPPPGTASEADLSAIPETVNELVVAVNRRNPERVKALTTPSFSARGEGRWFTRDGIHPLSVMWNQDAGLDHVEIATLVRGGRLVTRDVALADGFFRTIGWPGGSEFAGSVSVTLVKREGRWLVDAARFGAYHFDRGGTTEIGPAPSHQRAGADGWVPLNSLDAFCDTKGGDAAPSWKFVDGVLSLDPVEGSLPRGIRTRDTYRSFEVRFDWKLPPKGNSGLKYRLFYLSFGDAAGHEYQVVDDTGDPGAIRFAVERAGALYNQIAPSKQVAKPAGEWNSSVLIVRGRHCEHWLNGEKVVEYETDSGPLEGPLLIQDHGTKAWFRNIKIRRLD
jgi:hypothetical protein